MKDVRDGTLCPDMVPDDRLRRVLTASLRPDPERARRLERLRVSHGTLRPRDYWRLEFLACWTGGSMGHYLKRLADWWGPVPVRDIGLLASEGRVTIPLEDGTAAGVLDAQGAVFEFIPAEQSESATPDTLNADELEAGNDYEVVLTNAAGVDSLSLGRRRASARRGREYAALRVSPSGRARRFARRREVDREPGHRSGQRRGGAPRFAGVRLCSGATLGRSALLPALEHYAREHRVGGGCGPSPRGPERRVRIAPQVSSSQRLTNKARIARHNPGHGPPPPEGVRLGARAVQTTVPPDETREG